MRRDHTLAGQKTLMETEDTRQGSTDAGLLTWKELLHSGRASGKMVQETPITMWRGLMWWRRFLEGTSCDGWTSPSDDRRLPQTCKVQRIMVVVRP